MLQISRSVLDAIRREAAASPSLEICGLLFGERDRIDRHSACANVAERPCDSFEIDPTALIAAYRAERDGGGRIAGCYHSHPSGTATPSQRDAAAAEANGWVWLIVTNDDFAVYRASERGAIHERFDPVAIQITTDA